MLALILITIFLVVAVFHLIWGIQGPNANSATLPQIGGKPAFVPSRLAGFAVALAFLLGALLIAMSTGLLSTSVSKGIFKWAMLLMSFVFLVRAIGDFRLVGFFKSIKASKFARLDTLFFSPLCLGIALGILLLAIDI
jgi:hypothetical protein